MTEIGMKYQELRKRNNLKQIDFANKIGISQGTLSDIERGNSKPSIETVIATSKDFNISMDWLLMDVENTVQSDKIKKEMTFIDEPEKKVNDKVTGTIEIDSKVIPSLFTLITVHIA